MFAKKTNKTIDQKRSFLVRFTLTLKIMQNLIKRELSQNKVLNRYLVKDHPLYFCLKLIYLDYCFNVRK